MSIRHTNAKKSLVLTLVLIALTSAVLAQGISLAAHQRPLAEVLDELAEQYPFQYTGQGEAFMSCSITLTTTFANLDTAIAVLAQDCQLTVRKVDGVYVLRPLAAQAPTPIHQFKGRIVDQETGESVPSTAILVADTFTVTDEKGWFSYPALTDSVRIQTSHIAYVSLDTLIATTQQPVLAARLKTFTLGEVVVETEHLDEVLDPQYPIVQAYLNHELAPGYYRTFQEFVANQPGITWDNRTLESRMAFAVFGKNFPAVRPQFTRAEGKAMGDFVGFCDGQQVYFRVGDAGRAWRDNASAVKFAGPFARHAAIYVSYTTHGNGSVSRWTTRVLRVLNMEDGTYTTVGRQQLRALLQNDPELLVQFEAERRKGTKLESYLLKFVQRQ
ncbi:MAG TPA: hypothetical protein DCE41_23590 [Cytophagales bacterium]|nr:hypothetical protein [Cytophagales bacterium]HAP64045.1 hypothetical protein [Cytophagales bacterium]